MRHKLIFCSMLFVIAFAGVAAAKSSLDDKDGSSPGLTRTGTRTSASLNRLPYKNLLDTSKWSRLIHGRALTATLRKKSAHSLQDLDFSCSECGLLFAPDDVYGGDMIGPITELNATKGGCGWSCCFKTCMNSAMTGTGNLCLGNCTACGLTRSPWACAVCLGCGTVGFAAIEFCGLHCCVNPGC